MKFTLAASVAALSALPTLVSAAFDLNTKNNIMGYWGQNAHGAYNGTDDKQQRRLVEYCKDATVDIITIGFVNWWDPTGLTLTVNLSNMCWRTFGEFGRSDLLYCPEISQDIIACQKTYNKKIVMSIGGGKVENMPEYNGFTGNGAAGNLANLLWNSFGAGWTYFRPFGEAQIDGFDFNIEYGTTTRYAEVARVLRGLMDAHTAFYKKQWLLTASPTCQSPNAYLSEPVQKVKFDALYIQFYNDKKCMISNWKSTSKHDSPDFFNYGLWDTWVKANSANKNIKLFIGVVATGRVAWNAESYVSRTQVVTVANNVYGKFPANFGGVSIWDLSETDTNTGFTAEIRKGLNAIQAKIKKRDVVTPAAEYLRRRHIHHNKF